MNIRSLDAESERPLFDLHDTMQRVLGIFVVFLVANEIDYFVLVCDQEVAVKPHDPRWTVIAYTAASLAKFPM